MTPKYIAAEVFDKRAVDRGSVVFHDISFVEATPRYDPKDKLALTIERTDFSVNYTPGRHRRRHRRHEGRQKRGHLRPGPTRQN